MKQARKFVLFCQVEISQTMALHAALLVSLASSPMSTSAVTWFEIVWSYGVWKLLIMESFSRYL
jgi:hypothetical protein